MIRGHIYTIVSFLLGRKVLLIKALTSKRLDSKISNREAEKLIIDHMFENDLIFRWFPNNKGMAMGIVVGGFGGGAFVFNQIQVKKTFKGGWASPLL